jgi:dienelactone hydrolase
VEQARRMKSLFVCIFISSMFTSSVGWVHAQTPVSYRTEDGWTIHGNLYLPKEAAAPAPAIVLLPEPGWVDRSIYDTYLAQKLAKDGIAAIAIDVRGTGSSLGKLELEKFSPGDRAKIQLDVRGAVQFLASQKGVDAHRIAIIGSGQTADYAVLESAEQPGVRAVVLISGELGKDARSYIKTREHVPILSVVGKKDRGAFLQMAEAYSLSENDDSDIILAVGHGTVMFSHTKGLEEQVIAWLEKNLAGVGTETEVSFKSEDGWILHGTLHMPDRLKTGEKVPAVVLVHGAKHDQQTYTDLAPELVKNGIAAVRFDWRGKGSSVPDGKGKSGTTLAGDDLANAYLDVKAAIEFLASQPGIDANRIGLAAATAGTAYALRAAAGDKRIQTVVVMTASSAPVGKEKEFLTTSGKPIFAIASTEDINYTRGSLADSTRVAYLMSNSKESQFLLYDDAGRGSEILKVKPELSRMILRWFLEKLHAGESSKTAVNGLQDRH